MKINARHELLFRSNSFDPQSKLSFVVSDQVTLYATELHEDDVITFEVLHVAAGAMPRAENCCYTPGELPDVLGSTILMCEDCDEADDGTRVPVRLTATNPVVILDAPQGAIIRARYDGPGLGTSTVFLIYGTETRDLTPAMRGCPAVCCVHDPESWQETGPRRCDLEADNLEGLMVDNCGRVEWQVLRELNWQDTGQIRCQRELTVDGETYTVEIEQVNDCGDIRWVVDPNGVRWTPTGVIRCEQDYTLDVEGALDDPGTVSRQEVNQCGDLQWVTDRPQNWVETGQLRCVHGSEDDTEQEMRNDCGYTLWVPGPEQVWTATGKVQCNDDTEVVNGEITNPGTKAIEEVNQCGLTRWTDAGAQTWTDTGQTRCLYGTEDDREKEVRNDCGDLMWVNDNPQDWVATGVIRCVEDTRVPDPNPDGIVERQEINQCGLLRWVYHADQTWTDTGDERCGENGYYERKQTNDCGMPRWFETVEICNSEYLANYRLPCGGLAFGPGDAVDPEATVEVEDCGGGVLGYIYPTPRRGAQTPVLTNCDAPGCCGDADVLGYAVDGGEVSECCKAPAKIIIDNIPTLDVRVNELPDVTVNIESTPNVAVGIYRDGQELRVLWSDGTTTSLGQATEFTIFTQNDVTAHLTGDGSQGNPLQAQVQVSGEPLNLLKVLGDGLHVGLPPIPADMAGDAVLTTTPEGNLYWSPINCN